MPASASQQAKNFQELKEHLAAHQERFGHLRVQQTYVDPEDGYPTGRRLNRFRQDWDHKPPEQVSTLVAMGVARSGVDAHWEHRLGLLEAWAERHGRTPPPKGAMVDGVDLGQLYRDLRRRADAVPSWVADRARRLPFYQETYAPGERQRDPAVRERISAARRRLDGDATASRPECVSSPPPEDAGEGDQAPRGRSPEP